MTTKTTKKISKVMDYTTIKREEFLESLNSWDLFDDFEINNSATTVFDQLNIKEKYAYVDKIASDLGCEEPFEEFDLRRPICERFQVTENLTDKMVNLLKSPTKSPKRPQEYLKYTLKTFGRNKISLCRQTKAGSISASLLRRRKSSITMTDQSNASTSTPYMYGSFLETIENIQLSKQKSSN